MFLNYEPGTVSQGLNTTLSVEAHLKRGNMDAFLTIADERAVTSAPADSTVVT